MLGASVNYCVEEELLVGAKPLFPPLPLACPEILGLQDPSGVLTCIPAGWLQRAENETCPGRGAGLTTSTHLFQMAFHTSHPLLPRRKAGGEHAVTARKTASLDGCFSERIVLEINS